MERLITRQQFANFSATAKMKVMKVQETLPNSLPITNLPSFATTERRSL
jgi:hypothetical protein